ncbi:ubiquitin carboxyl-terminal hydrolase 5 isoform X1 [Hydra vulgaris]|uniref:ubiquitin carboxyl-terminal hydrolase 5 isoform X1 n=1 Tax=Hydra vulgaris TaxID=6087 RepID=UPI001F5F808B|nr:ubiquitin carboxyl-terminal hydrolase 5 [Hydra vulgaris]
MADNSANKIISLYSFTIPSSGDKIYKEECVYCFDSAISDGGLYVCLSTLWSTCRRHLHIHVRKKEKTVFLHLKKIEVIKDNESCSPEKKPTKLAIGVEGGFDVNQDKTEYEDVNCLVLTDLNGVEVKRWSLPDITLPINAQLSITAVLTLQGATVQDTIQAWQEKRNVSRHAMDLKQLNNGVKVFPRGWKCAHCNLTTNLWLNLTDGTILCGRKYFDGSGGNNHAADYYKQTGYPLAVKLGTITAEGGDVYSYDEDDMVEDPKLSQHLLHFGINIDQLKKTDKSMTELEIEANLSLKAEWDAIQESGKKLVPLYGPGYTGMINLGNSCYMNSVMQVLFSFKEFQDAFALPSEQIFETSQAIPPLDLNIQLAKLGAGLLSGIYSQPQYENQDQLGVRPQMLKSLIGQGHAEFSTNHQQDAHEFFLHLLNKVEDNLSTPLHKLFSFQFEERLQCMQSNKVSYSRRTDMVLSLPVPLHAATNKDEFKKFDEKYKEAKQKKLYTEPNSIVRLKVPMSACLEAFIADDIIEGYYSSAVKANTVAKKKIRFATFPQYLVVQLKKFTAGDDWMPQKLDVMVDVPDELDLNHLRGNGLQPGEELLPSEELSAPGPTANEEYVSQLMNMGFSFEVCKKAVILSNNQGIEAAMNWIFEHSEDPDFESPIVQPSFSQPSSLDPSAIDLIVSMGFGKELAILALQKNQNNIEAATNWIFSQQDEFFPTQDCDPTLPIEKANESEKDISDATDGNLNDGKYRLIAFISHMGTSTSCGHYVCHIYKDNRWVIYNDRKVAISEKPPKELGYIYFYKQITNV